MRLVKLNRDGYSRPFHRTLAILVKNKIFTREELYYRTHLNWAVYGNNGKIYYFGETGTITVPWHFPVKKSIEISLEA